MKSTVLVALVAVLSCGFAVRAQQGGTSGKPRPEVTRAQTERWMTELSNWGRWGRDDQLGTLNLITQEKRQPALALAKRGITVSLEQRVVITPKPEATIGTLETIPALPMRLMLLVRRQAMHPVSLEDPVC